MDTQFEIKLIECLSALDRGEPIEQIIARYPEDSAVLRPMLETATALPAIRMEPSDAARTASRRAFLTQAHALAEAPQRRRGWAMRVAAVCIAIVLALVTGGVVAASGSALPGDRLYGMKRTVERVQLSLASDPDARDALATRFEQERRAETVALLRNGREAEVAFAGTIESIRQDAWVVDGIEVRIDRTTQIAGIPRTGARAHVAGGTVNGRLFATAITLEPGGAPPLVPTVTPTVTRTPMATASPTLSPTATFTPEPSVTPAPTALPTVVRRPTLVPAPLPIPTSTFAPNDNDNDNINDNGNSNDNGNENTNGNDNGNSNGNGNENSNGNDNSNDNRGSREDGDTSGGHGRR
jgi:hypothetical protein